MLPVIPCLIHWHTHQAHDWAYTSTGGGHMVRIGSTDERDYEELHCQGLAHVGRHRGTPVSKWMPLPEVHRNPKHRGPYKPEVGVDTGYTID